MKRLPSLKSVSGSPEVALKGVEDLSPFMLTRCCLRGHGDVGCLFSDQMDGYKVLVGAGSEVLVCRSS